MKRFYTNLKAMATKMLAVALVGVAAVSCAEAYDDTDLQNKVADLTERVTTLEERLDSEVAALRALIDEKVALAEAAADGAWKFTLADGKTLTVYPQYVDNGITVVTVGGVQYWAKANGAAEPVLLKDAYGNPIEVVNAPEVRVNAEGNVEVSVDGGATWVACEGTPGLFAAIDVKENHACLTLQSGEVLKFALYEQVNFNINGNALFIAPAASEKVTMTLDGIVEIIPLVVPKGWDISIDGLIMTVTAPAVVEADEEMGGPSVGPLSLDDDMGVGDDMGVVAPAGEAGAASGAVKVLAVSKEGKVVVATLKVTATEMYTSLKVVGDDVVLTNNNYFENWYGDLMPMDLAYAIFPSNEYTVESFVASNPAGWNSSYKYEIGFYSELGTVTFKVADLLKELCGIESVKRGDSFTVVAFDPNAYSLTADVIMKDVYAVTYLDVEVGETTFKDANINIAIEGYSGYELVLVDESNPPYYGPQEMFEEMVAQAKDMKDAGLSDEQMAMYLQPWGITKEGNYNGSIFAIDTDLEPKANNTYSVYVWPKVALKSIADYTWEDVKGPYYVKTKNYTSGGMLQPTFGLVDNWGDILPEATYQTVNVAVIPAEGAYMTYGHYFEPEALKGMSDADIVAEVLKSGFVRKDEPVNVMAEGLKPGTTVAVVGFCVDQNGKYGPIIKKEVTTKNVEYSTATIEIADFVVTPSFGMSTDDANYSFNVKVNGEVSPIYFRLVEVDEYMNVEGTAAELAIAILGKDSGDPTLENYYLDINVLPKDDAGKYTPYGRVENLWGGTSVVGLNASKDYMIIVGGVGADGLPTKPVYHKFDTFPTLTMIYADDAKWAATKPVVKVSENMTATQLYTEHYEWEIENEGYVLTGEALTYPAYATKEITIQLAEGCTELIVGCFSSEYVLGKQSVSALVWLNKLLTDMEAWPTFESEYDKIWSNSYYNYKGEAKEVTFSSAEFATWVTTYLDIAWKDAEGNWYESTLELLHEEYLPEGLPNLGGGGIATNK